MNRFSLLAVFLLCAMVGPAAAAQRQGFEVTKTYLNEGNDRTPIAVACSSSAWTAVLPAAITRRASTLHTLSDSDGTVCLSTATASDSSSCAATTLGIHLEKGGAYVDNSEAALYCKVISGSKTATAFSVYVYGMSYIDTKDNGDLTN